MASAKRYGEHTLLSRLYLRPAYQGRGIGRLLLNVVLSGAPGPVALTVLSGNDRARAFYEAHGFREDGRVPRSRRRPGPGANGPPVTQAQMSPSRKT